MAAGLSVVVVGLGFGAEFVPVYAAHPDVRAVGVCDADPARAARVAADAGGVRTYPGLAEVLGDPTVDAVHLVTPLTEHAAQSLAVLDAGRHCASTVPMAVDLDDLHRLVAAERAARRNYMMMETAVFTREFLHAREMFRAGDIGPVTLARGTHYQDMSGWPSYWRGLPPMWYATHAVSPVLALLDTRTTTVRCLGSGRLPREEAEVYGNPFPAATALFTLEGSDAVLEVSRTLSQTARTYTEAFAVYGERGGFEWAQLEELHPPVRFAMGPPAGHRGRGISAEYAAVADDPAALPAPLVPFTTTTVHDAEGHPSVAQGGGHGGSHPRLVHEFVRSIVEDRPALVDARRAADWTAAGIAAHRSALRGGEVVEVPAF